MAAVTTTLRAGSNNPPQNLSAEERDVVDWSKLTNVPSVVAGSGLTGGGQLTNDVTVSLTPGSIGNSSLASVAANTLKGNNTGGTTTPTDLTTSQVTTMLAAGNATAATGTSTTTLTTPSDVKYAVQNGTFFDQGYANSVARAVTNKARDYIDIRDFMTASEITDVTSRTASIDVASKINFAIAQVPSGSKIYFPPGKYRIGSTITLNRGVTLIGAGMESEYQPASQLGTALHWYGGASPMINFGGFGTTFSGGGIENLRLKGNAGATIATHGLFVKDVQHFVIRNIDISYCSTAAIYFTNTALADPTAYGVLENVHIQLRGGITDSAHGIWINGVSSGSDGVTLCRVISARIDHANGAGVLVGDIGDNWSWYSLYTFRANSETGSGVWFNTTSSSAVCNSHHFVHPHISAGFRFDTPGQHYGTRIENANQQDMNTSANLLYGTGCQDVWVTTQLGAHYGLAVLAPSLHSTAQHDTMRYLRYDSGNNLLTTAMQTWRTILTGTPTITATQTAGGGLILMTGAVNGNRTTIIDTDTIGNDGWYDYQYPVAQCVINPLTASNVIFRIGWMDGVGATPSNGCYVELDPSVNSGKFQIVTRKAGTETRVNSSVGASSYLDLQFHFQPDQFVVFYRTTGNKLYSRLGLSTTNIPTLQVSWAYSVETKTAAAARLDVFAHRVGGLDEQMFF